MVVSNKWIHDLNNLSIQLVSLAYRCSSGTLTVWYFPMEIRSLDIGAQRQTRRGGLIHLLDMMLLMRHFSC